MYLSLYYKVSFLASPQGHPKEPELWSMYSALAMSMASKPPSLILKTRADGWLHGNAWIQAFLFKEKIKGESGSHCEMVMKD